MTTKGKRWKLKSKSKVEAFSPNPLPFPFPEQKHCPMLRNVIIGQQIGSDGGSLGSDCRALVPSVTLEQKSF